MGLWERVQLEYFKDRVRFLGLSACVGVVVALVVAFNVTSSGSSGSRADTGSEAGAWVMCSNMVEEKLRSPSTADFPSKGSATITGGPSTYSVSSYVDAQNGFGATVRETWTCEATYVGDDSWRVSVSLD